MDVPSSRGLHFTKKQLSPRGIPCSLGTLAIARPPSIRIASSTPSQPPRQTHSRGSPRQLRFASHPCLYCIEALAGGASWHARALRLPPISCTTSYIGTSSSNSSISRRSSAGVQTVPAPPCSTPPRSRARASAAASIERKHDFSRASVQFPKCREPRWSSNLLVYRSLPAELL